MKLVILSLAILSINRATGKISQKHNEEASEYCEQVNCDYFATNRSDYDTFIPIENLTNIESSGGYIVRFPLIKIGSRNAYIVFTDTDSPNWRTDKNYEFEFNGWFTAIQNMNGSRTYASNRDYIWFTKILIEITDSGYIRVFLNNDAKPVLSTFDPKPLRVKYVSFRSKADNPLEYLYNCPSLKNDRLPPSPVVAPAQDEGDLYTAPLNVLTNVCKWHETWRHDAMTFYKIDDLFINRSPGLNRTTLEFYIVWEWDARIVRFLHCNPKMSHHFNTKSV